MPESFEPRVFGKTGARVGPLGIGSSYGIDAKGVEEAFERGVNYFYWGWRRRDGMRDGLRYILRQNREKAFITIPSLAPTNPMIRYSVERALKALNTDYIDGLHFFLRKEKPPWRSQLEPALKLKEEGKIQHIGISSHHRPNFPDFLGEPFSEFYHVRYNAKHRGAESDVFPKLPPKGDPDRPGIVAFTVTSWKQLIKANPKKLGDLAIPTAGDCYRFALSHPDVDVCITGAANAEQMRHALDAIDKGPMTDDELGWMRKVGDRLYKK
ncbi:hypothetical protein MNBD_NITROSPINAE04-1354 [hydrothermal vent metagenome]|uniref:NADP-dependent oxidoreductase domain-containing protein n=1 Tax=hydrothermal vent metagenome TaxID=652676 RepID=A0A3B1BFD4_9ZZZZ